jgi:hypothetical protein
VVLKCNRKGDIILPWDITPSPYRLEYPPFLVINGLCGKIVMRKDRGLGCIMTHGAIKPSSYELF